jgi:L-malate glycosyltransferase
MSASKSSVLHVVDTLTTGGAEIFVMRLTQAMRQAGWSVSIFVLRSDRIECDQLTRLAPDVPVSVARVPFLAWLIRLDGALYSLGFSFSLTRWWQTRMLVQHIRAHQVDVLHSHLMTADLASLVASQKTGVPWLSTMHGDYFKFEHHRRYRASRIFDFPTHFQQIDQRIRHVVCISEPQKEQWKNLSTCVVPQGRISKIYNGYSPITGSSANVDQTLAGIPAQSFVIGMVARGAREKGWDVMVQAFAQLDDPRAWLVLVGDGEYLPQLRADSKHPQIIFAGNVTNPANWIARFDLACLPTRYDSESLPNSVVEYLFEGKPVVATDVGEIAVMLRAGTEGAAGQVLALDEVDLMSRKLTTILRTLMNSPDQLAKMAACARGAAEVFKMQRCVEQYFSLYKRLHVEHK